MKIATVVYAGEDEAKAVSMAKDLMNANPSLTGLVGECTSSAPGVAKAVREAGKIGKVFTVGLGTPQAMKPYLDRRLLQRRDPLGRREARLPHGLGRQAAGRRQVDGPGRHAEAQDPHRLTYVPDQKMLLLGPALRITKANVDQFNY